MITEDYVSFETAKLLKEKGFAETSNTIGTYNDKGEFYLYKHEKGYNHNHLTSWYSAPTLQMTMKWLREVHNYAISICLDSYVEPYDNEYYIVIRRRKDRFEEISPCEQVYFKTYEQACEAAIKYCLENLI